MILSGDVHYSFAYDIRLKHKRNSPEIWQITSSGIKNEFPHRLLEWLDRLNRWLFAPWSPLNWFTKRRRMRIRPRLPEGRCFTVAGRNDQPETDGRPDRAMASSCSSYS